MQGIYILYYSGERLHSGPKRSSFRCDLRCSWTHWLSFLNAEVTANSMALLLWKIDSHDYNMMFSTCSCPLGGMVKSQDQE